MPFLEWFMWRTIHDRDKVSGGKTRSYLHSVTGSVWMSVGEPWAWWVLLLFEVLCFELCIEKHSESWWLLRVQFNHIPVLSIEEVLFHDLWGIGPRTSTDTQICRCSSLFCKMTCWHITYIHCPVDLNSSLQYLWCIIQYKYFCCTLYEITKKHICIYGFSKLLSFFSAVIWIHGCGTYGYRRPKNIYNILNFDLFLFI